ncbi:hypothetical protein C1H46_016113 [Malus baccata]|uniref:Transport and Golgi organization protein 2 homolog n=1 Tax=Malus baccata TaxID=106549 RepID=A0A540MJD3_MALBA|nr:hypothetical protein C1H46_016113 [Malus baccata]
MNITTGKPTKPVGWWEGCEILGGRDEVAGGTWLACSRGGRLAFLSNVLELDTDPEAKSRGDLPVLFLKSTKTPKEFAQELAKEAHRYNGFNLVLADIPSKTMIYLSNRPKGEAILVQEVSPGIHVLSNAKLDSPWHKGRYGTRSSAAVTVRQNGALSFYENYLDNDHTWKEHTVNYQIQKLSWLKEIWNP